MEDAVKEFIMRCPTCIEEKQESRIYPGAMTTTAMYCQPFYDEAGRLHYHDRNTRSTTYECSNGHVWTEDTSGSCWCGWPEKSNCGRS